MVCVTDDDDAMVAAAAAAAAVVVVVFGDVFMQIVILFKRVPKSRIMTITFSAAVLSQPWCSGAFHVQCSICIVVSSHIFNSHVFRGVLVGLDNRPARRCVSSSKARLFLLGTNDEIEKI